MYSKIINPLTNRKVSIYSNLGKKIINNYINVIQHVHVSDQNLSEPGTKNVGHDKIGAALRQAKFNNYVSIEMRKKEQNNEKAIKNSICFVRKNYLNK